jgi:hypothetical protein
VVELVIQQVMLEVVEVQEVIVHQVMVLLH